MLKPVVRPREHRPPFVPDDLLVMQEADPQQAVEHFARELRCVPDVRDLEARHQFEGFGPVGARVAGDRGFGVALGPVLHVAGFGGPAAVQAGAVAPFGIELDSVRRIGHHQLRLALAQQPRHGFRAGRVAAEDAMRCLPQSHRSPGRDTGFSGSGGTRRSPSSSSASASRSSISLGSKPVRLRSKSASLSSCSSRASSSSSQSAHVDRAVHHQAEGLHLRRRPLVAEDHRDCGRVAAGPRSQLARSLQAQVTVHDLAVAAGQHGDLEAELADAAHMRSTAASFLRGLRA